MISINRLLKGQAILALVSWALVLAAAAAAAASTFPSGAGPGWPKAIGPGDFVREVTNPWFPLKPGSVWHYEGLKEGMKTTDKVTATHRTKKILGVTTTVVHDVVSVRGKPEEVTDDFYAQDRNGNVWYFGEETEELNANGKPTSTEGSFEAGVAGARPGVLIPGHPKVGLVGRQEFLKGEAEDHFQVLDLKATVSVPFTSTRRALRTREWTPLESATVDNKYYVRGVGTVREIAVKGPVEKLELTGYKAG
ncbi:MAG TPA: hypothetical protein VLK37_10820 [Solirubrobacterales bacterium]|nr:hypothetical protein [Solirubrobacterales bacterium]